MTQLTDYGGPALGYALAYARLGMPVTALWPDTRTPVTRHGWKDGTTDPAAIRRLFDDNPERGILICLGLRSDIWALDVDRRSGGMATLAALELGNGILPDTPTVVTGSDGRHIYFAGDPPARRSGALRGLDVLVHSAIAPPTTHSRTGLRYTWTLPPTEGGVAPAPAWLVAALSLPKPAPKPLPTMPTLTGDHSRYIEAALAGVADDVARTPPGQRQATLNRAAFRLGRLASARGGLSDDDAIAALMPAIVANGLATDGGPSAHERTIRRAFASGAMA